MEILEPDAAGQPFGQRIQVQRAVRRQQRFPVLCGDGGERMHVLAQAAALRDHRIGGSLADQAIGNQHAEQLRQVQFVFVRTRLLHCNSLMIRQTILLSDHLLNGQVISGAWRMDSSPATGYCLIAAKIFFASSPVACSGWSRIFFS